MNKENEEYSRDLFKSLEKYDSEFTEIIYNFSQVEVEKGLDKQVALFGKQMLDNQTTAPKIRKNINRWLASNCFGDYYTRTGLNDKEREMITFC